MFKWEILSVISNEEDLTFNHVATGTIVPSLVLYPEDLTLGAHVNGFAPVQDTAMAGLQLSIWTSIAIPWLAALVSLVMRIFARKITKISWWFDDYFAVLAFVSPSHRTVSRWTLLTVL